MDGADEFVVVEAAGNPRLPAAEMGGFVSRGFRGKRD
jgi:hypothetical protein